MPIPTGPGNSERDGEHRTTRFSDVCGSLDELKRQLREEAEPDTALLGALLEDVRFMLGRMERRLDEYVDFAREADAAVEQIRGVGPVRREEALAAVTAMEDALAGPPSPTAADSFCALAEQVRDVANELEQKLRRSKDAAISLYRCCIALRGGRDWGDPGGTMAPEARAVALLEPWLPPAPHRERVLDFLARGRAHLLPPAGDGTPRVEFEDGGVMPLPAVRWSEAVGNFYPDGHEPHPGGRRHRA